MNKRKARIAALRHSIETLYASLEFFGYTDETCTTREADSDAVVTEIEHIAESLALQLQRLEGGHNAERPRG